MKDKLIRLKKYLYQRLPLIRQKQVSGFPASGKPGVPFEFVLKDVNPEYMNPRDIREIILLNPYTIATHPVVVRLVRQNSEVTDLEVSYTVLNQTHGEKIEESIRSMLGE